MIENELTALIQTKFGKSLQDASDQELYYALLAYTKEKLKETPDITGDKKLYYISAEFLIGKLLSNNLINLGSTMRLLSCFRRTGKSYQGSRRQSRSHH